MVAMQGRCFDEKSVTVCGDASVADEDGGRARFDGLDPDKIRLIERRCESW